MTSRGRDPTAASVLLKNTADEELAMGNKTEFESPPPGLGVTTVTEAVPGRVTSEAGMVAVNCELLTKVVGRAAPFQFTREPETKPVPLTMRVKPAAPGAALSG